MSLQTVGSGGVRVVIRSIIFVYESCIAFPMLCRSLIYIADLNIFAHVISAVIY